MDVEVNKGSEKMSGKWKSSNIYMNVYWREIGGKSHDCTLL